MDVPADWRWRDLCARAGIGLDADQLVRYVADSTQGFTLLMAGLKAWLEHKIKLTLTTDRYPKALRIRSSTRNASQY
jgi:hypothetical protein